MLSRTRSWGHVNIQDRSCFGSSWLHQVLILYRVKYSDLLVFSGLFCQGPYWSRCAWMRRGRNLFAIQCQFTCLKQWDEKCSSWQVFDFRQVQLMHSGLENNRYLPVQHAVFCNRLRKEWKYLLINLICPCWIKVSTSLAIVLSCFLLNLSTSGLFTSCP